MGFLHQRKTKKVVVLGFALDRIRARSAARLTKQVYLGFLLAYLITTSHIWVGKHEQTKGPADNGTYKLECEN